MRVPYETNEARVEVDPLDEKRAESHVDTGLAVSHGIFDFTPNMLGENIIGSEFEIEPGVGLVEDEPDGVTLLDGRLHECIPDPPHVRIVPAQVLDGEADVLRDQLFPIAPIEVVADGERPDSQVVRNRRISPP